MLQALLNKEKAISVTGLGYVGLPLALALARKFRVIGFDINAERVAMMQAGIDPSNELEAAEFEGCDITFTSDGADLAEAHFHIIAVPTPIDASMTPNLKPVFSASEAIGKVLKAGDYVVYESTVYPGCTEEDCNPILERVSGLKLGQDYKIGYSPERINPGDKEHTITKILKVVSGSDDEALEVIDGVYGSIITAGTYRASSIRVAEAAKVIENTQRDLNIAFMNELSIIFDKLDIDTQEVLQAAGTKWNFLKFYPGLVGGHCIGVDPYYLLHKSRQMGYEPQVINSGRRINDAMPGYIAKRLVQLLSERGKSPGDSKVLLLGITFKENVTDIRNSKVADLVKEIMSYSINVHVSDPWASPNEVAQVYGLSMVEQPADNYDAIIVAVAHDDYRALPQHYFTDLMNGQPILMDLKGLYSHFDRQKIAYWRL